MTGDAAVDPQSELCPTPRRVLWMLLAMLLVATPFLLVQFPPITDLPQHAAQIRLFGEAWGEHRELYRVQWLTPYGLAYALLGAAWWVAGPRGTGRIGFLLVALLWVIAIHALCARRSRPTEQALLATLLVFNHALYWGFLSFLVGWIVFLEWLRAVELSRSKSIGWPPLARLAVVGLLLYSSHALWFAAGALW